MKNEAQVVKEIIACIESERINVVEDIERTAQATANLRAAMAWADIPLECGLVAINTLTHKEKFLQVHFEQLGKSIDLARELNTPEA